jgi:hypothetical protein
MHTRCMLKQMKISLLDFFLHYITQHSVVVVTNVLDGEDPASKARVHRNEVQMHTLLFYNQHKKRRVV